MILMCVMADALKPLAWSGVVGTFLNKEIEGDLYLRRKELDARAVKLDEHLSKLGDMLLDGTIDAEEFGKLTRSRKQESGQLKKDIAALNSEIRETSSGDIDLGNVFERWYSLPTEELHGYFRGVIEVVRVHADHIVVELRNGEAFALGISLGNHKSKMLPKPVFELIFPDSSFECDPTTSPMADFPGQSDQGPIFPNTSVLYVDEGTGRDITLPGLTLHVPLKPSEEALE
jgi:hypothetical protein